MISDNHLSCFENVAHEEVNLCAYQDVNGGLNEAEIYYTPANRVTGMSIPAPGGSFEDTGKITGNITFQEDYGFRKLNALVDESELETSLNGRFKRNRTELAMFVLGLGSKLIGLSILARYWPLIFLVKDRNGKFFAIGNTYNPAYITGFKASTGKKYEDNNGADITLSARSSIYEYTGSIEMMPNPGDFDQDFDLDFD